MQAEKEKELLFHEDFDTLDGWKPYKFPKIERQSSYSIVQEGSASYLRAESNASASALLYKTPFDITRYNKVRWRWKIENVYEKRNAAEKTGDDYPIRIYIIFEYDPDDASFAERITYGLAKTFYGEYPPHSSLNYIWGNKPQEKKIITSTYTDRAKMIVMESGVEKAKTWVDEEVNILDDYKKAFGKQPPSTASIAIMSDSDNTGESSISYIDFIEVYR
ncbi:MAG: DUF3047 domain-containing protein [Deltaproteobacteria bacterium]|nr:DUF3047 domain-containing protein [Deltaproteobacteria bacterium]